MPTPLVATVATYLKPYVDLLRLSGERYYFRKASTSLRDEAGEKRNWHPKIEHVMLRDFHDPDEGILYAALPKAADLAKLSEHDLLYIGCSGSGGARYWRGRPSETGRFTDSRSCFHHEQMRRGRDGENLERHLVVFGPVRVYTLTDADVLAICARHQLELPPGKYPAHQMECKILAEGFMAWKWNKRC